MRKWTNSSLKNQNCNVCRPWLKKQRKHGWKNQNVYVDISILSYTLLIPFFVFRFEFLSPWLKKRRRYGLLCSFTLIASLSCHKPNKVKHRYPFKFLFLFFILLMINLCRHQFGCDLWNPEKGILVNFLV